MPIYNYSCRHGCDYTDSHVEVIQKHDDPAPLCAGCQKPLEKDPCGSSFAFVTKGGNLFNFSGAAGRVGRHRPKAVTIGKGAGLGSDKRRKKDWEPVRQQVQAGLAEARVAALRKA